VGLCPLFLCTDHHTRVTHMEEAKAPTKSIDNIGVCAHELCALITTHGYKSFFNYVEKNYVKEFLASTTRHMPGGWPVEDVVILFLHWISNYPVASYYERRHSFPHTALRRVLGRVIHLAAGWADTHLTSSTPEKRAEMPFSPLLPQELLHLADTTLFCDGVEYGRWGRDINTAAKAKEWYAKKLRGPGWRVMVHSSHFFPLPILTQIWVKILNYLRIAGHLIHFSH